MLNDPKIWKAVLSDPKNWIAAFVAVALSLSLELVDLNEPPARWFVAALVGVSVPTVWRWFDNG